MNLTFGEQLLLLLKRKNMTILEFSELLEARTGVPCPAESLKQQLKKDNFLEQDMSILAAALDRQVVISLEPISTGEPLENFSLFSNYHPADNSIQMKTEHIAEKTEETGTAPNISVQASSLSDNSEKEEEKISASGTDNRQSMVDTNLEKMIQADTEAAVENPIPAETNTTVQNRAQVETDAAVENLSQDEAGTVVENRAQAETNTANENHTQTEIDAAVENHAQTETDGSASDTSQQPLSEQDMMIRQVTQSLKEAVQRKPEGSRGPENAAGVSLPSDSINPYTQEEYLNNTVRKHPNQERYIQVYDVSEHKWIDVPENYFQKFQYVKRKIMGRDYTPPIYI